MAELFARPSFLILLCASAYAVATLAIKLASETPALPVLVIIALCLTSAVVAEVLLMRQMSIGLTYVAILGAETLLVLGFTYLVGEAMGIKQLLGAMLVLGGAVLVTA